jgi:hypothetical protein
MNEDEAPWDVAEKDDRFPVPRLLVAPGALEVEPGSARKEYWIR